MTLTLDKGLATERSVILNAVSERPLNHTLNGTWVETLEEGSAFPNMSRFGESQDFETVTIESGGETFPISGMYNFIVDYSVQYNELNRRYSVSVTLGWEEPHDE